MSKRKETIKVVLLFALSIILTILVEVFSSKIIHYADWARVVTSIVYWYMFIAIIADARHVINKNDLRFNRYHSKSLKWEVSFIIGFFFLTLIISDIAIQVYDNLAIYFIIVMIAFSATIYFVKKLNKTV